MRVILVLLATTLTTTAGGAEAQDVLWQASLIHYGSKSAGYDAWAISAGEFPKLPFYNPIAPPADFDSTLEAIFTADKHPCINSIVIMRVSKISGLREEVFAYLTHVRSLAPYMATEPRRWRVKDMADRGPELLREAILKTDFVATLDRALKKRGKSIRNATVSNVKFLLNEDPADLLAMINLYVDE